MKILLAVHNMKIGGVQKSLLNLIDELIKMNFEIHLFIMVPEGELLQKIPKSIIVKTPPKYLIFLLDIYHRAFKEVINTKSPQQIVTKLVFSAVTRLGFRNTLHQLFLRNIKISDRYSIAVSYDGIPDITDDLIKYKVNASQKIGWVHSDSSKFNRSVKFLRLHYSKFDKIAIVSKTCESIFLGILPEYKHKSNVVYNMFNSEEIITKSLETIPFKKFHGTVFVTVGRLDNSSKRIDRIIEVVKSLKNNNIYSFKWYLVGDGPDYLKIKKDIELNCIGEQLILLGSKINPYPYIKYADFFVMSSDFEGYPMTIKEALILNTPCITVNFDSASEVVIDGVSGIITPLTKEGLYHAIEKVINDKKIKNLLKHKMQSIDVSNNLAISQFNKMFNL